MKSKKLAIGLVSLASAFALSACNDDNEEKSTDQTPKTEQSTDTNTTKEETNHMDHAKDTSNEAEVPDGLKAAENPKYEVGSKATIKSDHMEGMDGAEATIVGAYDTTAYSVTYTPTTEDKKVENHKWVIHEEIEDAGEVPLEPGTEVTLDTDHIEGMEGAKGVIEEADTTTVYMVDYKPTDGGIEVKNHQWVTESELSSK